MMKLDKPVALAMRPRPIRRWVFGGVVALAVVASAVAARAEEGASWGPHGHGSADMMGGMGGMGGMDRHLERALDGLGLTEAQRGQVRQIIAAAGADLKAQHAAARGLHERGLQIFTAPTVDASAAEVLRQQMLTQHDQSSKRVLQAMLDISQVLTPDQRAKLGARMKDRQSIMQDRMHRMQRMERDVPPGQSRP